MKKLLIVVLFVLFSAVLGMTEPRLVWESPGGCVDGYRIYQGTSRSYMVFVLAVNSQTFEVPLSSFTLEAGQRYYFAVTAYNSVGESDFSNIARNGLAGPMDRVKFNRGHTFKIDTGTEVRIVK